MRNPGWNGNMRTLVLVSLAVCGLVSGCGKGSGNASNNAGQQNTNADAGGASVLTAPVDYLDAIARAKQSAVKTVGLASVNEAIRQFQTAEGRNPKDLDELVQQRYLGRIPPTPYGMKLIYDSKTGEAKMVKQ